MTVTETPAVDATQVVEEALSNDEKIVRRLNAAMEDPLDAIPTLRMILFGDIGSGKTTAACDAPNVLLAAIERGQSSLINHPEILAKVKKVLRFSTVRQIELLADQLKKENITGYDTVVLDTFSELSEQALDDKIKDGAANDFERVDYKPEDDDYKANGQHMRRIAAAFKDVPCNVIFICHEREDKNAKTGLTTIRPNLSAKVSKTINQYADIVAYMWSEEDDDGEQQFFTRLRPTKTDRGLIQAKTRIKSLPSVIKDFTFDTAMTAKLAQIEEVKKERQMTDD